ncbi:hypothetical protein Plhal304r1_c008g0032561 [Plasmopara halstedii]
MTSPPPLSNMLPIASDAMSGPPAMKKKKPGRTPSLIWQLLTDEPDPQRRNSATCKHCKESVAYYKKSEQAIRHLKKCSRFQEMQHQFTFMNQFSDHLPLYNQKVMAKSPATKRPKTDQTLSQRAQAQAQLDVQLQATGMLGSALDQAAAHHAQVMNQIAMQRSLSEGLIDPTSMTVTLKDDTKEIVSKAKNTKYGPLSKTQNERFEEELAMHVYSFSIATTKCQAF